jgi:hypothetical protein
LISLLRATGIDHNQQIQKLHEALEAATDSEIDRYADTLRTYLKNNLPKGQMVGMNTAREILAAIGVWLEQNDQIE